MHAECRCSSSLVVLLQHIAQSSQCKFTAAVHSLISATAAAAAAAAAAAYMLQTACIYACTLQAISGSSLPDQALHSCY
jgi:hypothetical protein